MDILFLYSILVGIVLFAGTVMVAINLPKVKPSRRGLYVLNLFKGLTLTTLFGVTFARRYLGWGGIPANQSPPSPPSLSTWLLMFALFLVACTLIVTPIIDRYEQHKLGL